MHSNLACHEVLSTRDHVRASFYSEGSGPFSPVNESKKKLKCRLGSWGRPLKKVTLPSRPEGWLWSHCFSVIGKNQKRAKDLSTPKWHITQGMPFHQQPVEASQWDGGGGGGRLAHSLTERSCGSSPSICMGNPGTFPFVFLLWSIM